MDGVQERTKQGPSKKAHTTAKGTAKAEDQDQPMQQLYMLDQETGVLQPVSMAHVVQQKSGGKRGKGGKGAKPKKTKPATPATQPAPQQPLSIADMPRGMCRAYYVDGQCPRWEEHGFCPFQHFTPDQIALGTNGYWKPKPGARPGLAGSTLQDFHPSLPELKNFSKVLVKTVLVKLLLTLTELKL